MALANDDDVIKTLPSNRVNQALRISVLPRRPRRDRSVANAHNPDVQDEGSAYAPSRSSIDSCFGLSDESSGTQVRRPPTFHGNHATARQQPG
jgi:hypothetical protein